MFFLEQVSAIVLDHRVSQSSEDSYSSRTQTVMEGREMHAFMNRDVCGYHMPASCSPSRATENDNFVSEVFFFLRESYE